MAHRTYTAEEVARALAVVEANQGSLNAASRELGISRATIRAWRGGRLPRGVDPKDVEHQATTAGREAASRYRVLESKYLDRLEDPKLIAETKARDAIIVAGTLSDKAWRAEGGADVKERREVRIVFETPSLAEISQRIIEGTYTERGEGMGIKIVEALPEGSPVAS